eukprot:gene4275-4843_t
MERGFWSFIKGTEIPPGQTVQAAIINIYHLRSDKAYTLIALSVNTPLHVHISQTTDPKEEWEILKQQFEFVLITQIVRLNRKFSAASMPEGTNLDGTFDHNDIFGQSAKRNERRHFVQEICHRSLPEFYKGFISSARASDELNWDNIKGLLVEEYMKQKERSEEQPSVSNDALFTRRGFHSSRGNRQHGNGARPTIEHQEESRGRGPECSKCKRLETCTVIKDERILVIGHIVDDRLYTVNTADFVNVTTSKVPDLRSWHCRFGHLNYTYIDEIMKKIWSKERFHKFGSKDEKKLTFPEDFNDSAETPVHSTQADLDDVLEEDRRADPVGVNYEDRFLEEVRNLTGKRN